ncbi:MAG: homoserine dehydrogenase [Chloroflexi bacterium]|nr:homoserine dehydrogenase [Chloroflexota bacterium]
MSRNGSIGVGLLGLGVVGSQVARVLLEKSERIAQQVGRQVTLRRILVRDRSKARDPLVPRSLLTVKASEVLEDPAVGVVVEVMGGEQPALDYLRRALSSGRHAVTANKEVMAKHGPELIALAEEAGVHLTYEASVGGGIPIIGALRNDLLANEVTSLHAIINGTTNYILTKMAQEGLAFETALGQAQALGYAEADPANDVEGLDAAFKLAILASLAFHTQVRGHEVYREGIARLTARDFQYARELGYTIKLLAIASRTDDALLLRVHPSMVPLGHLLAKVDGVFNAIEIQGDLVGQVVFHGQGAGALPTSSAVAGDILEVARSIASGRRPVRSGILNSRLRILPVEEMVTQYYARLTVTDRAGVLAQIARTLGDLNISIASVIQKNADPTTQTAEIVIMTHPAQEASVQQAVRQARALDVVREVGSLIRVEHWS